MHFSFVAFLFVQRIFCFQNNLALVKLNYSGRPLSLKFFSFWNSVRHNFSNELNILKAILSRFDNSPFPGFCMKSLILVTISPIISLIPSSESMFSSGSSNVATFCSNKMNLCASQFAKSSFVFMLPSLVLTKNSRFFFLFYLLFHRS